MADYLNKSNRGRTELRQDLGSSETTAYVESGTGDRLPSGNFSITIEDERILVGNRNGDTLESLTRGWDGTVAADHESGSKVNHNVIAEWFDELEQLKMDNFHIGTGTSLPDEQDSVEIQIDTSAGTNGEIYVVWNDGGTKRTLSLGTL